jgi:hypothetical protein
MHFSPMTRQMTGGVTGYCLVNKAGQDVNDRDTVDVVDVCRHFAYGPDDERKAWYSRWLVSRGLPPK